jgi:hypothetical protein
MTPRALAISALFLLALPAAAQADGPPVGFMADGGVTAGSIRYAALPAGGGTLMEKLALDGGRVLRTHYFKAALGVPMVAMDGTAGGLSQDRLTLVIGKPRTTYPERHSTLYVLNARNLSVRRKISLPGDFSYDAISPDGKTIYLTQLSQRNFTDYAIRAFDTRSWRLDPKPVVDRREPDEAMRGFPYTRVMSPDGRFAYTLYGGGEKPFVHALDTTKRSAACIDIPPIRDSGQMTLRLTGRRLTVVADGTPIAFVDTATRHVWQPAQAPQAPAEPRDSGGSALGTWLLVAGGAVALAGVAVLRTRRRRARTAA